MGKSTKYVMPCVWEAKELQDGVLVQILTAADHSHVWAVGNDWARPLGHGLAVGDTDAVAREAGMGGYTIMLVKLAESPHPEPQKKTFWDSLGFGAKAGGTQAPAGGAAAGPGGGSGSRPGSRTGSPSVGRKENGAAAVPAGRGKEDRAVSGEGDNIFFTLKAPNGNMVAASPDGSLTAHVPAGGELPDDCVLRATRDEGGTFAIWSMSNERYLRAMPDGSLLLVAMKKAPWSPAAEAAAAEGASGGASAGRAKKKPADDPPSDRFRIRRLDLVPKFFGPNLGGWLVAEAWMCPPKLFDGVFKDLVDGTSVQFQSPEGKWVAAEGGGGDQLLANRDEASAWETFYLRRTPEGGVQIRAGSGHFWSVDSTTQEVVANSMAAGKLQTFWLRRKLGDESTVQLRSSTGHWLRAGEEGAIMADIDEDVPGWETTCSFMLKKVSDMGGEVQLVLALGKKEAAARLKRHRDKWVTERDFEWMARHGVNAVRLPVGWWAVRPKASAELFVPGALDYVDKAFTWAHKNGIRVLLCLHAAPGSQNGWEHSASRDGIPQWGRPGTTYVQETLEVLRSLLVRYAAHPSFAGLEAINEPRADSISFKDLSVFYLRAYRLLRQHSATAYFVIEGRIFANEREWDNFMTGAEFTNVVYDAHWYQVHDHAEFEGQPLSFNLQYPAKQRAASLRLIQRGHRLVMIGEWSLALLCDATDDTYTRFGRAQLDAYLASSAGCFFWSLKHGQGWDPWDFRSSVTKGWLKPTWWSWSEPLRSIREAAANDSWKAEVEEEDGLVAGGEEEGDEDGDDEAVDGAAGEEEEEEEEVEADAGGGGEEEEEGESEEQEDEDKGEGEEDDDEEGPEPDVSGDEAEAGGGQESEEQEEVEGEEEEYEHGNAQRDHVASDASEEEVEDEDDTREVEKLARMTQIQRAQEEPEDTEDDEDDEDPPPPPPPPAKKGDKAKRNKGKDEETRGKQVVDMVVQKEKEEKAREERERKERDKKGALKLKGRKRR